MRVYFDGGQMKHLVEGVRGLGVEEAARQICAKRSPGFEDYSDAVLREACQEAKDRLDRRLPSSKVGQWQPSEGDGDLTAPFTSRANLDAEGGAVPIP